MILPFSTQLNGKPTQFVEAILKGLFDYYKKDPYHLIPNSHSWMFLQRLSNDAFLAFKALNYDTAEKWNNAYELIQPKVHTIRLDKNNRWRKGVLIHFFINARQKNMFQFAPVLPVISTQDIEFRYKENSAAVTCLDIKFDRICTIFIDGKFYGDAYLMNNGKVISSSYTIEKLAKNDGFEKADDFFAFFNEDYNGKIIHWTDLKY